MLYATLYIEDGNLLTWHEDRSEAEADVLEVVEGHPELADEYGYLCFDETGDRVGEFISGTEVLAKRSAAA